MRIGSPISCCTSPLSYLLSASLAGGEQRAVGTSIAFRLLSSPSCASSHWASSSPQLLLRAPYGVQSTTSWQRESEPSWASSSGLSGALHLSRLWKEMVRGGDAGDPRFGQSFMYSPTSRFPSSRTISSSPPSEYADKIAAGGYGWLFRGGNLRPVHVVPWKGDSRLRGCCAPGGSCWRWRSDATRPGPTSQPRYSAWSLSVMIEVAQFSIASGRSEGMSLVDATGRRAFRRLSVPECLRHIGGSILPSGDWANAGGVDTGLSGGTCVGERLVRRQVGRSEAGAWQDCRRFIGYPSTTTITRPRPRRCRVCLPALAMYLPVGFGYWALTMRERPTRVRGAPRLGCRRSLASRNRLGDVELGKLFVPGKYLDPTDVLIAAAASAAGSCNQHAVLTAGPRRASKQRRESIPRDEPPELALW